MRFIDGGVESQTISKFLIGRIAQDRASAANDNGNLRWCYHKSVKKLLGSAVGVEIQVLVGISIPAQEFAQSQGVRRVPGTEQDDVIVKVGVAGQCYTESRSSEVPNPGRTERRKVGHIPASAQCLDQ